MVYTIAPRFGCAQRAGGDAEPGQDQRLWSVARARLHRLLLGGAQGRRAAPGGAIRRAGEAEIVAQRRPFVFGAEEAAPLQLGNQMVDDVIQPAREDERHDVEPVRRARREPLLEIVGDPLRRAVDDAMGAGARDAPKRPPRACK